MTETTTTKNAENTNGGNGSTGTAGLSSPIVAALEAAWAAIQDRHPEIPDVVIVLASGSVGAPRGALKLGHFAAMRWTHATTSAHATTSDPAPAAAGTALPEVFVGGEGLALGPVDVLGTLLHEATHALAHVRGIKDCSRQGRYHNRRFRDLATEMGLAVLEVPVIGWSDTHVPHDTETTYKDTLDALAAALTLHRRAEGTPITVPGDGDQDGEEPGTTGTTGAAGGGSRNGAAATCGCGRRIRVTASVLALGPITCGLCGAAFTTPGPDGAPDTDAEGTDASSGQNDESADDEDAT